MPAISSHDIVFDICDVIAASPLYVPCTQRTIYY